MPQKLDIDNWSRKDHFHFFNAMDEPFWGVTVSIDCTHAYALCKEQGISFFIYYLHKSCKAVNAVENLRYRIIDDEIVIYDKINASATILRPDETFGFSFIEYDEDFNLFQQRALTEIERIKNNSGLETKITGEDVIYYSALPWINFSMMSHPRSFSRRSSVPMISFGKLMDQQRKKSMNVSIHCHHGLVDAIHVGKYIEAFQKYLNQ